MKYIFLGILLNIASGEIFAQTVFSEFLQGVWKVKYKDTYERWDKVNETTLRGFSYKISEGEMIVSEYLEIRQSKDEIIYTATVLNQNDGSDVKFSLQQIDSSTFSFENPQHDFPKKIVYKKRSPSEIAVSVSDGGEKGFSFIMEKQSLQDVEKDSTVSNPDYDKALAEKLDADDYGMKSYILVILKTGTNKTTDKAFITKCFRGHLDNINRLVEEDKLIVAGPMGKNENNYRGIFILNNTPTLEGAKELLQTDPAIGAGLLDVELYNWYGSAALPVYLETADRVWKVKP